MAKVITNENIISAIKRAVPENFSIEYIGPETELQSDLGIDSVILLGIIFELEEEYSVDLFSQSSQFVGSISVENLTDVVLKASKENNV